LPRLNDPRIRNEVAVILAQIGDRDALPRLIELLPTKEAKNLTREEEFSTFCLLYALGRLTDMDLGLSKFGPPYTPEFRKQWQAWYESNRDYLYTPREPRSIAAGGGRARVLVDVEAKLAGQPAATYRKGHPWVACEDIKTWRDDPAYEQKLKDFCFSVILNLSYKPYGHHPPEAIRALGRVRDPRALSALHALCGMTDALWLDVHDLIWTLEDRGDPSSIPFLEKIPRATGQADSIEPARSAALERIRLLQRYGKELRGKPFDPDQQTNFMLCLAGSQGVEELIAEIRKADPDYALRLYLRVAGYVGGDRMRSFLKEMAGDESRDDRSRTLFHAALARQGEDTSVRFLKKALTHKQPGVRLAAAEGLWGLGRRDGFQALVELTGLRPLETGGEGVSTGGGVIVRVEAIRGSNMEIVRQACEILGDMGDRRAVEPLKRLLSLNLNGVLEGGGSGTGWSGRPDAVALAKLSDFSGVAVLRASIRKGDPLDVVGSWEGRGDFVQIGLKRFIPELLPLLEHPDASKRVLAAQAILLLLEGGR
jgi:hypothetical protein